MGSPVFNDAARSDHHYDPEAAPKDDCSLPVDRMNSGHPRVSAVRGSIFDKQYNSTSPLSLGVCTKVCMVSGDSTHSNTGTTSTHNRSLCSSELDGDAFNLYPLLKNSNMVADMVADQDETAVFDFAIMMVGSNCVVENRRTHCYTCARTHRSATYTQHR